MTATSQRDDLDTVLVRQAMHEGVLVCPVDTPLSAVAELMSTHNIHCMVVADDPEGAPSLWGIVSDLDLVAAATVRSLDEQSAGGSAATPALTIAPDESLRRAAQMMTEHAVAHLVVVEPTALRPVGVLSTLDVARVVGSRRAT
jgi:CBS domain-containing protein